MREALRAPGNHTVLLWSMGVPTCAELHMGGEADQKLGKHFELQDLSEPLNTVKCTVRPPQAKERKGSPSQKD